MDLRHRSKKTITIRERSWGIFGWFYQDGVLFLSSLPAFPEEDTTHNDNKKRECSENSTKKGTTTRPRRWRPGTIMRCWVWRSCTIDGRGCTATSQCCTAASWSCTLACRSWKGAVLNIYEVKTERCSLVVAKKGKDESVGTSFDFRCCEIELIIN